MERPSHRELLRKLREASRLVESGRWAAANPLKLAADFARVDLYLADEQQPALRHAMAELKPEHYCGGRPPQRSYERATKGAEMFAFSWDSERFGKKMYFKFALTGAGATQGLYVYSLHESRAKGNRT